jgi:signal transduction histidine kinase
MNFCRNAADGFDAVPVSINKAVQEMVAIVQQEFRNASIGIETVLAENLPMITGNNNYLQQVFLNLLINARDAMPRGGKITVSTGLVESDIHVSFSDTGTGINKENLTKIFQPFFTTKALGKGTGLGLSVSNKIVGQHGGTISVESEEGKGTTFTIILPFRSTAK